MSAPALHGPAQLPDLRLWLAEQWRPGRPFARVAAPLHARRGVDPSGSPALYRDSERSLLAQATLWWVAEDMVDLLLAQAASIPEDVRITDLPKMPGCGLIVFEKPWRGHDAEDPEHLVTVDALVWGPVRLPKEAGGRRLANPLALAISSYRHLSFTDGLRGPELQLAASTGALGHAVQRPLGAEPDFVAAARTRAFSAEHGMLASVAVETIPGEAYPGGGHGTFLADPARSVLLTGDTWVPLGRSDWPVEDALGQPPWPAVSETESASMIEDRKVLAAFWVLIHQEGIASRIVRAPERQAVRRTERAGIRRQLADVQVITLRRLERTSSAESSGASGRTYDHRWLVAGHWRWQPVGPGRSQRRLTWVRPHTKGPADKPFHAPERVNAWTR